MQVCCDETCGVCATENECPLLLIACVPNCDPMNAVAVGECLAFFGYAWDGQACVALNGCSCSGSDCDVTFETQDECEHVHSLCPVLG
jgi:hypothetical protein